MTWAAHITLAPAWLDPAETLPVITPYMLLYAVHDALVKPMPGGLMSPSLATTWRDSPDGLTYDFELRQGVKFHNGDPLTAADGQFSFERYRGTGATLLKSELKAVEIVNQHTARDHQKRAALLHKIQRKVYDEARFMPIWELTVLHAGGPRVAVSGLGMIPLVAFSGPYEELQLKS